MKKFCLNYVYKFNHRECFNATSKARLDVSRTFNEMGILPFNISLSYIDVKFLRRISQIAIAFFPFLWNLHKLQKGDIIYIQYPEEENFMWLISKGLKLRGAKIVYLIHDAESARGKRSSEKETTLFNMADTLYVHTEAMQNLLREKGIEVPMKIIHVFDYYTTDSYRQIGMELKRIVIFAGNLEKASFIKELSRLEKDTALKFNLYGLKPSFDLGDMYRGAFAPEETSAIEGGWGLVWDGDSIETCSGVLGHYLRYNSSHKLSLYLAAGIPVIVWEQSALASWVKKNNVGITVQSLVEVEKYINAISDNVYANMIDSVRYISSKLRNGEFLKSLIMND